jgi:CIC family chloride channel protein
VALVTVRDRWGRRRDEIRDIAARSRQAVLFAAAVGLATGFAVALFETIVVEVMLEHLLELPLWVGAVAPGVGLAGAALSLRYIGRGASAGAADEYIKAFHHPTHRLGVRAGLARIIAAVSTLGTGAAMGLEGPSVFLGSTIGAQAHERLPRRLRGERRALLVAGAAAGVAAIFKAPATGAVFALEVPYQNDLARHMLMPALIGAATGYLGFATIHGTAPLLPIDGDVAFNGRDLAGAIVLGVLAGLGARWLARAVREAKRVADTRPALWRVLISGSSLAALFVAMRVITGESLTIESGFRVIEWSLDPEHGVAVLVGVLVLRSAATVLAIAGGGVGGVFIPLVVAGALMGRLVGDAVNELDTSLFVVVGIAAFLGAGYRVPLASVMFVAETTGRASIVVPGLFAAVAAELVMGPSSVTNAQHVGGTSPPG